MTQQNNALEQQTGLLTTEPSFSPYYFLTYYYLTKQILNTKHQGILGKHQKTKPKNGRDRRSPAQRQ